ncbi:MAG: hypothetical protein K9G43_00680 [Rhodobacteraceae bacterium]|nr:hypothetical protein [Paracoccaceae bacterium]
MALAVAESSIGRGGMIGRIKHVQSLAAVTKAIDENLELIDVISTHSDSIDYGEMIWVNDASEGGINAFTDRAIDCLSELLADICIWNGEIPGFRHDENCEPDPIDALLLTTKTVKSKQPSAQICEPASLPLPQEMPAAPFCRASLS